MPNIGTTGFEGTRKVPSLISGASSITRMSKTSLRHHWNFSRRVAGATGYPTCAKSPPSVNRCAKGVVRLLGRSHLMVKHVFVKEAARLNNRAENIHQATREREPRIPRGDFLRGVRGFRDPARTQAFLSRPSAGATRI
jgi:hypothetical protein